MKKIFLFLFVLSFTLDIQAQAPRKVIVEDFTGLWCGWCPLGKTAAEHLDSLFGSSVINIAMHDYDSLQSPYSESIDSINNYGFPGGLVDRSVYKNRLMQTIGIADIYGSDMDSAVIARLSAPSPVAVSITSTYNNTTRLLSAMVTADFLASAAGNMRINCVLTEDSIQTDDSQANYMDGNSAYPNWFGQGDPIPLYTQRHTARINLSSTSWGDKSIIPVSVTSGSSYSKTYSYTIPSYWNVNQMKIVGFISKWGAGISSASVNADTNNITIINANDAAIIPSVGISENAMDLIVKNCYPNPTSTAINIPIRLLKEEQLCIKIFNATGIEVACPINSTMQQGEHLFQWNATDDKGNSFANGIYTYIINTNESAISKHFVLNR